MSQLTAERPVAPTPTPVRTVTVLVGDQRVTVEDPDWCTAKHSARLSSLEDLVHESTPVSVGVPTMDGTVPALAVYQAQWPFARKDSDRLPYLSIAVSDGGDGGDIQQPGMVDRLADDLEQHAVRLRALGRQLTAV